MPCSPEGWDIAPTPGVTRVGARSGRAALPYRNCISYRKQLYFGLTWHNGNHPEQRVFWERGGSRDPALIAGAFKTSPRIAVPLASQLPGMRGDERSPCLGGHLLSLVVPSGPVDKITSPCIPPGLKNLH